MITETDLLEAHAAYHRTDDKIVIPRIKPDKRATELRMRSSALGLCPRMTAILRLKMYSPPTESYGKLMMLEQGNRIADVWQEALTWAFPTRFRHEVELGNSLLVGRLDGLFQDEGVVIEIKNTEYYEAQWKHIIQTQAGMWLANATIGYLIYQRRDNNRIFAVERDDQAVIDTIRVHNDALKSMPELTMRYGECIKEKAFEDLEPHYAKSTTKKHKKGDYIEPEVTPQCGCFGYCWGLKSQLLRSKYNEHGEVVISDGVKEAVVR